MPKYDASLYALAKSILGLSSDGNIVDYESRLKRAIDKVRTDGLFPVTGDGIAVTSTDGLVLSNTTASTVGVPVQQAPRLRFRSHVWDTDGSDNTNDWIIESVPASAGTTSGLLKFGSSLNGAGYTFPFTINSNGAVSVVVISASSDINAGAASSLYWATRSILKSPATGQMTLTTFAGTAGVGFDVVTDAILKIRTTALSAYATVDALGYKVSGVAGANFGPAGVTSITVVNGIVTAIS